MRQPTSGALVPSWRLMLGVSTIVLATVGPWSLGRADDARDHKDRGKTVTPIKHVIVLIGENRTFDHVFATYKPRHGQSLSNLLSRGIINADGSPGPNAAEATQFTVNMPLPTHYFMG
jgi:phospholipase C